MIIFNLDGTLANCEHRFHFIDPSKDQSFKGFKRLKICECSFPHSNDPWVHEETNEKWKPDWKAFYEACDKDEPIKPVIKIINELHGYDYYDTMENVHIWSGRCESVREKTEKWLDSNGITYSGLKMRPIGDSTPDDVLKQRWLDEHYHKNVIPSQIESRSTMHSIEFVFDSDPKSIEMWRRRGIFVFNCNQSDEDF